jgi:hypothetical protein
MNRGDILTKVIAVAKRNGFGISDDFFTEIPAETWISENQDLYFSLIFCHDFAISFFGEGMVMIDEFSENPENIDLLNLESPVGFLMANRQNIKIPNWQYHLAQMVLYEDPLMYLFNFINDHEQAELN